MICSSEFVSIFCDVLANQRLVLESDIFECILNFLEHAALGETVLVVTSEFRTVLLNVVVAAMDVESDLSLSEKKFNVMFRSNETAISTLIELMDQNYEDVDDEDKLEEQFERREQETPVICDILTQLASNKEGAQALVKAGVDKKMQTMFEDAKKASDSADDEESQNDAFDKMEKALSVLVPLAVIPQVQKMLFDKKCEPSFRKILNDSEGSDYVRAEVLGLLANLVEHDKWAGAVQTRTKEYIDGPIKLCTHWLINVRAAALTYLGTVGKVPVLALSLAGKTDFLKNVCLIAMGQEQHDEKPEFDDEEEEEEEEEEEDDPKYMAVTAMSALTNMCQYSKIAEYLASNDTAKKLVTYAISSEQDDYVLRTLAGIMIGKISLHDKEKSFTPSAWLDLLVKYTPSQLPNFDDEKTNVEYFTLNDSVIWDIENDVVPLAVSPYDQVRRFASYLLASVSVMPSILESTQLKKSQLDSLLADVDSITSNFAKLTVEKL